MLDLCADLEAVDLDDVASYEGVVRIVDQVILVCAVVLSSALAAGLHPPGYDDAYLFDCFIPSLACNFHSYSLVHLSMADNHSHGLLVRRHFFPLLLLRYGKCLGINVL